MTSEALKADTIIPFTDKLKSIGKGISRLSPRVVQINLGKVCNQACKHCHVDAGPRRTEALSKEVSDRFLSVLKNSVEVEGSTIDTLDITGGAPEMNSNFKDLVIVARKLGLRVIDRCNLTILTEPGYEYLPTFLSQNSVDIVASLPCYDVKNVDFQRGRGVFARSIEGLKVLNKLGYGKDSDFKKLDLVYNPIGASLPPSQGSLEAQYKERLFKDFGIKFNSLFTITNIPISRFASFLSKKGELTSYYELLQDNFNANTIDGLMCRDHISVSYEGGLYDCDFNQMEELPIGGCSVSLWDIDKFQELKSLKVATGSHCYGCTAGCGSSCGGTVV